MVSEEKQSTSPLTYKKFLGRNLINFSRGGFGVDFRELLVNNRSFGNPIGCLLLLEAALDSNKSSFSARDLGEVFPYLAMFGVVNESINPVVCRALSRVFEKVSEDVHSADYWEHSHTVGVNSIFDGVIRAEFWAASLFELSLQAEGGEDLFFSSLFHFVLRKEGFSQSSRLFRRLVHWALHSLPGKRVEFLYMMQSVDFLFKVHEALSEEESSLKSLSELQSEGVRHFLKSVFNSVVFFTNNFFVKIEKNKQEKQLVEFLTKRNFEVGKWKANQLEKGIVLLLREVLKLLSRETEKTKPLSEVLLKGKEQMAAKLVSRLDEMTRAQMED